MHTRTHRQTDKCRVKHNLFGRGNDALIWENTSNCNHIHRCHSVSSLIILHWNGYRPHLVQLQLHQVQFLQLCHFHAYQQLAFQHTETYICLFLSCSINRSTKTLQISSKADHFKHIMVNNLTVDITLITMHYLVQASGTTL